MRKLLDLMNTSAKPMELRVVPLEPPTPPGVHLAPFEGSLKKVKFLSDAEVARECFQELQRVQAAVQHQKEISALSRPT